MRPSSHDPGRRERGRTRGPALWILVVATAVAVLLLVLWSSGGRSPGGADPAPAPPSAARPLKAADREPATLADYTLRSGEIAKIELAAPSGDRPLALDLALGEPSRTAEPLAAQLRDMNGRVLDLPAAVAVDGRMSARIEIEPGWLSPGSYLVELRTTERSHFPMRRYPLEVR